MFYPLNYRALCNSYRYNFLFLFTINLNFTTFALVWKNIRFEDRRDIVKRMSNKNIDFYQMERIENSYKLKATKLLFDYSYKVINIEHRPTVDNYMILYESPNKDENTIREFVEQFRAKLSRPTNITIIDDIKVKAIMQNYKPRQFMSRQEIDIQAKHWIAYSTFDAPEFVWMYPEK